MSNAAIALVGFVLLLIALSFDSEIGPCKGYDMYEAAIERMAGQGELCRPEPSPPAPED